MNPLLYSPEIVSSYLLTWTQQLEQVRYCWTVPYIRGISFIGCGVAWVNVGKDICSTSLVAACRKQSSVNGSADAHMDIAVRQRLITI